MEKYLKASFLVILITFFANVDLIAQNDGNKQKGMGSQSDLDKDFKDGQEKQMSPEQKKRIEDKKKEVAAKRKKGEKSREQADKTNAKMNNKTRTGAANKKKRYVKSHGG